MYVYCIEMYRPVEYIHYIYTLQVCFKWEFCV